MINLHFQVGDVVTFTVEIEVTSCPKDRKDWKQTLQIYPVGINESLIIDLEMLCDCPCERPGQKVHNLKFNLILRLKILFFRVTLNGQNNVMVPVLINVVFVNVIPLTLVEIVNVQLRQEQILI